MTSGRVAVVAARAEAVVLEDVTTVVAMVAAAEMIVQVAVVEGRVEEVVGVAMTRAVAEAGGMIDEVAKEEESNVTFDPIVR